MWDYDKLFAEGNIVGFKHSDENQIHPYIIYEKNDCMDYFNDSLCYKSKDFISKIQYIIRLDELCFRRKYWRIFLYLQSVKAVISSG